MDDHADRKKKQGKVSQQLDEQHGHTTNAKNAVALQLRSEEGQGIPSALSPGEVTGVR